MKAVIGLVALVLVLIPAAAAGELAVSGTVLTTGGAGLAGASVVFVHSISGARHEVVSGERGLYRVVGLDPGEYEATASVTGYLPARAGVTVAERALTGVVLRLPRPPEETVVVMARTPQAGIEVTGIRESHARDVGEVLCNVPGVWALRKGGIANDVVVRGHQSKDLTVLVDGQRVYGACPNHMDPPAFHVDFAEVERAEVAKGPFDVRYHGSLGGVVNVVTRRPQPGWHGETHIASGSSDYLNPSAVGSWAGARGNVLMGLSHRASRPYRDGAGKRFTDSTNYAADALEARAFDVATGWTRLGWNPAPGHALDLAWTRQQSDLVLYPYLQMDAVFDDTDRVSLTWEGSPPEGRVRMRAESYYTGVRHWMTDAERTSAQSAAAVRGYSMGTLAIARTAGGRFETSFGGWTVGAEAFRRHWDASTAFAMGGYVPQASLPGVDLDVAGLFAQHRRALGPRWTLDSGLRADRAKSAADPQLAFTGLYLAYHGTQRLSQTDTYPSGHLRATWRDDERGLEVSFGAGRAVRVPEPNERYYSLRRSTSDWVGNPELEPSRNTSVDAALDVGRSRFHLGVGLHASRIADYITVRDQQIVVNGAPRSARTYGATDATLLGGEVDVAVALTSALFLSGDVSYVRGSQRTRPELGIFSSALAEMPPLRARLALRWNGRRFWGAIEGLAAAEQGRVDTDLKEERTPGYGTVALKGGFAWKAATLTAGVGNVFDRDYSEHLSYYRDPFRNGVRVHEQGRSFFLNLGVRR